MKIIWSKTALLQLEDIYKIYADLESKTYSKILSQNILNRTKILFEFPEIGAKQEFTEKTKIEYRYLIEGNYKIIYYLTENDVNILIIFDTRQEPNKLNRFLK